MHNVSFCENNFVFGTDEVVNSLQKVRDDVKVSVHGCQGHCEKCGEVPYALVDSAFVEAESSDKLMDKVIMHLMDNSDA